MSSGSFDWTIVLALPSNANYEFPSSKAQQCLYIGDIHSSLIVPVMLFTQGKIRNLLVRYFTTPLIREDSHETQRPHPLHGEFLPQPHG